MSTIHPDVSEFQDHIDSSFNRDFVMLRISNEHGHVDDKIKVNLERALDFRRSGKIVNLGGYIDPGVVDNSVHLKNLETVRFPKDAVVMIDAESWPQKKTNKVLVSGDHSAQFNELADAIRSRQNGRADLVWGYGNTGDLNSLWPHRPSWLGLIVASYGLPKPSFPNMVGGQDTDDKLHDIGDRPRSTPPFGNCDHNELFIPIPNPEEDDMTPEQADQLKTVLSLVKRLEFGVVNEGGLPFRERGEVTDQIRATRSDIAALRRDVDKLVARLPAEH